MSIIDLSAQTQIAENTIYRIENGIGNVTISTLNKIAHALGISIKELL